MFRILRYVFLVVVAVALMVFATANRGLVTLYLLPPDLALLFQLDVKVDVPAYVMVFLGLILGLLVGFTIEWLREHRYRRTANTKSREVSKLERELAAMKDQTSLPDDPVLALLDKPKR
jgi:putative membrane protein